MILTGTLAAGCGTPGWFTGIGGFLVLAGIGFLIDRDLRDEPFSCCLTIVCLWAGGIMLGYSIPILLDGCPS